MLDRRLAAVGLLGLLSVAWIAGGQPFLTEAAPAGQFELVRAAIHPGSCAAPEPGVVVTLTNFSRAGEPGDLAAPLTSYTEAAVALPNLLATPHVILVTLGGDPAATLACGDIDDLPGAIMVTVNLSEQDASGLSGISLLMDVGAMTRVSIILDEGVDPGPGPVPSAVAQASPEPISSPIAGDPAATAAAGFPIPTLAPIIGEPTATPGSVDLTPSPTVGGLPSLPIVLPPIAQGMTPVAGTTPETGPQAGTYTSQELGYSIEIPNGWEIYGQPLVEPGFDQIILGNGQSWLEFTGMANPLTAPECLDRHYEFIRSQEHLVLVVPHTGPDAATSMRTPERAIEVWDEVLLNREGQPVSLTLFVECRVVEADESVLLMSQEALVDRYPAEAVQRELVFSGVTLP